MNIIPYEGQRITVPGVYSGISNARYHSGFLTAERSTTRSKLWKLFDKSPAHHWDISPYNEEAEPPETTAAMLKGQAAHHLLLGEQRFSEHFAVRPEEFDSWRTNAAKEWRAKQEAEGKGVLIPSELEDIRGMAFGLHANPLVRSGILDGLIEHTMVAQDPETGIWVQIRPDAIPNDSGDYADLKTTADITDAGCETALGRDGLIFQGALTRMVCRWLGLPFTSFTLVFVESGRPFCVQTRTLLDADLDLGEEAVNVSLRMLAKCTARNVWPGPGGESSDALFITLKPWDRKRIEDQIKILEASL